MNLKKITSLTMLLSMIIMTYTGIILFIAPPGRIANWANWELLALTKEQYGQVHSTTMVLFIIATILHLIYNWKPITSYMKNKTKQMVIFTKDMMVAFLFTAIFVMGTLTLSSPFSNFLDFGSDFKESWQNDYGIPPYSHAELSSLENFCKKVGFDIFKCEDILEDNNIEFEASWTLSEIAKRNKVSPQFIFNLLRKNFEKEGKKVLLLSGVGKKKIKEVASVLNLSEEEFILKLKGINIIVKPDDNFKSIAEKYQVSPSEILEELGYKIQNQ